MAKQDVLDAINATIVENGQKGITAQALNNVLTMMTENAGEGGSGDGALRVMVPDMMMLFPFFFYNSGEFTPAAWEEFKAIIEQEGSDASALDGAINEAFTHNAKVYQTIKEKAIAGEGCPVLLDQAYLGAAAMGLEYVGMVDALAFSISQPAACVFQLEDYNETGEAGGLTDIEVCGLAPLSSSTIPYFYPENLLLQLLPNGGILFQHMDVLMYIPTPTVELSDEQKSANRYAVQQLYDGLVSLSVVLFYTVDVGLVGPKDFVFVGNDITSTGAAFRYFDGLNLMQTTINASDGATTTEVIGTLNAPTA